MIDATRAADDDKNSLASDMGGASPAALMRTLDEDVRQIRIGNTQTERVPVHTPGEAPDVRFVRFADLSANVRSILDKCPTVDVVIDGQHLPGARAWRIMDGHRGPVLEWHAPATEL